MNRRSLLLGAAALGACAVSRAGGETLVIRNAKIYPAPDAVPIEGGAIVARDGRIASLGADVAAPRGAQVIDAGGGAVTAGFWNSHVHIFTPQLLHAEERSDAELTATLTQMFNRWGFTSVFDVASILANTNLIRARVNSGAVQGPHILTVGEPFFPLGGTPFYVRDFLRAQNLTVAEAATVEQAVAQAERQLAAGANGLKLFTGAIVGGDIGVLPMPLDIARAAADVAHRAGKPVFAHPSNLAGLQIAIEAGVDILAHTAPMAGPWPADFIARLRARNMALAPTLELFEIEARRFNESTDSSAFNMDTARQQAGDFLRAGGDVLFGTDVGYTESVDTRREFELLQQAGLDLRATLAALTTTPARRFGFAARKGRIAPGMDADLVVLSGDPGADLTAFSRVQRTIRGGRTIYAAGEGA